MQENNHKSILKSTGLFGFSQIIKMIIGVISSKLIAIFLGPIGVGIVGLLNNTINIITAFTSFGFNVTSVREVSLANSEDKKTLSNKISFLLIWSIIIGLLGTLIAVIFSLLFSQLTFGTTDKYHWFILLSINFIIVSLTTFCSSILQGTRMLKQIVISNTIISLLVALISIPIYYFYKFSGIIPVLLVSSLINLIVNYYFVRKLIILKSALSFKEILFQGKPLVKLGFVLSINVIFGYICTYIIKLYLNGSGSTAEVLGFYEVSNIILISYVGMIFNAMSVDFYPKLTSIQDNNHEVKKYVNNQIEIALLIVTPAIMLLYFSSPLVIKVLYTNDFLNVLFILKLALFSVIIRAIIWPLGFIILAKGNKKQYFKQELFSDFANIIFTILFYHFLGLIGIGIAIFLQYIFYGFYVFSIVKKEYSFSFTKETKKLIWISISLGALASTTVLFLDYPNAYFVLGFLTIISTIISYIELNKRVNLTNIILKIKNKFKRTN